MVLIFQLRSIKGKPPSPRHAPGIPPPSRTAASKPPSVSSPTSALPRKSATSSPRRVPVARVSPAIKQCPPPAEPLSFISKPKVNNFSGEEVKNWGEVEGTPLGFSNATSLSDLTVDSASVCSKEGSRTNIQAPLSEAPHRYATENTPAEISRCDSLSSLSCEEGGGQINSRLKDCIKGDNGARATKVEAKNGEDVTKSFNVEDTPAVLSRRSSLSSIDGMESKPCSSKPLQGAARGDTSGPQNFTGVEGTPVCFSRNSSLSSLSVESYPEETTPSEQALLQRCISQGMPKGERNSRGTVATPRSTKRGKSGSRIPGLSHSPGRSPGRSPGTSIPGVPMSRLQLVPIDTEERPDAESSKLRSDIEQTEKKEFSADDDQSLTEDITEVTEPMSEATTAPIADVQRQAKPSSAEGSSPDDKDKLSSSNGGSGGDRGGTFSDVSMTDSMIVATEALRVARAMEVQGQEGRSSDDASIMSQSITSENLLENIPAPSAMESCVSLSASLTEDQRTPQMPRKTMECRHTRKIPAMVRRALGDQEVDGNNSMASSCHSNLDNVVPPSFLEADDMESSMISVASITSEVADPRHSPPSMTSSIPSEVMAAIEGPAHQIAKMLQRDVRHQSSTTVTLTAGEETSTYQEVTELDRDDTLGCHDITDTFHSADEIPPDIPDLPPDSPVHRMRGSPQVTPSMLRKAVQNSSDKYRTFTRSERKNSTSDANSSLSTKSRRSEETFVTAEDVSPNSPSTPTADHPLGAPQQRRSLKEKRTAHPTRYQTRTIESGSTASPKRSPVKKGEHGLVEFRDGAELDLTIEQLEALSQDANIVICTLNENREANTADLLHGLSQENILDIETLSLISSDEEENTFDVEKSPATPARPRIIKPGDPQSCTPAEEDDGAGKGIRGRRKGLYPGFRKPQAPVKPTQQASSPGVSRAIATPAASFKPTPRGSHPTPQHQPQTPGSPKLPRATRTSELRLRGGRVGSSSSSSPASSAGSSPRMGATSRPSTARPNPPQTHVTQQQPGVLRRQNTFTKDDEEGGDSSAPQATKNSATKTRYRKDVVQPMSARQLSKGPTAAVAQTPKSYSLTRDVKPPSASDMADWSKGSKTGKKDVTSRIASLWKKVEKAQAASKPKENDARVWISKGGRNKTPVTEEMPSPPPLVRSSTYEKLSINGESPSDAENSGGSKNKTRLGLKLSRLRGRDTKSSPPSEVCTPVDQRPQCVVSPNSSGPHVRRGQKDTATTPDDGSVKRLSRLGSFTVVGDGEGDGQPSPQAMGVRSPQAAVVAPFHYQPPSGGTTPHRSRSNSQNKPPGDLTRIPMPAKSLMSNNPRDDNGNAPLV